MKTDLAIALIWLSLLGQSFDAVADSESGLVAYYPFNGSAEDASGNGNHGMIFGAKATKDMLGQQLGAYSFDGVASYIEIPRSPTLSVQSSISIFAWVNSTGVAGPIFNYCAVCQFGSSWGVHLWETNDFGGSELFSRITSGSDYSTIAVLRASSVLTQGWKFVGVTYDYANKRVTLWKNGKPLTSTTALQAQVATDEVVRIGKIEGDSRAFRGSIDEIRVYNRALSGAEIAALYSQKLPVSGVVNGLQTTRITCINKSTGQSVTAEVDDSLNWNCRQSGLTVRPGEEVNVNIEGLSWR